jgi:hypothetical protein
MRRFCPIADGQERRRCGYQMAETRLGVGSVTHTREVQSCTLSCTCRQKPDLPRADYPSTELEMSVIACGCEARSAE